MKSYFSRESLDEMRGCIHSTLVETFQIMFQIDISMRPQMVSGDSDVCSYIEMVSDDEQICLSVAVSRYVVDLVSDGLEPGVKPHSPELTNDIVSEISNIIANVLRTHMINTHGVTFNLGLPQVGLADGIPSQWTNKLNIHFNITAEQGIDLQMTYTESGR